MKPSNHWNSSAIIKALEQLDGVVKVKNLGQGGDVDTDNLEIVVNKSPDSLYVCGFVHSQPESIILTPSDSPVELIELTDGKDSRGGLHSGNKNTAAVYGAVHSWFIQQGFEVVPQLKDYF